MRIDSARLRLQRALGIDLPILQAPIGNASSPALVIAVSNAGGLGMLGILVSATGGAVAADRYREAGVVALLVTASDVTIAGIGSPFWGLVAGAVIARLAPATPGGAGEGPPA